MKKIRENDYKSRFEAILESVAHNEGIDKREAFNLFLDFNTQAQQIGARLGYSKELCQKTVETLNNMRDRFKSRETIRMLSDMYNVMIDALEEEPHDFLGEFYMKEGLGDSKMGQVFTPLDISMLMAELVYSDAKIKEKEYITLNEPTCGSGGNVVAMYRKLKALDCEGKLRVVAQDISLTCVQMCFLTLNALGIDAVVVHGNTLIKPYAEGYPEDKLYFTLRYVENLIKEKSA